MSQGTLVEHQPVSGSGLARTPVARLGTRDLMIAAMIVAFSVALHWHVTLNSPLWFDEAGTAAFAASPSFSQLIAYAHGDSNAPLFYILIWAWAKIFGLTNLSLRVPSLIFSLASPLLGWAGLRRYNSSMAIAWAVTLALWIPGIDASGNSRCYAMLYFAAVGTSVAFCRLVERPTLRRATIWSICSAATALVHYDAVFLCLIQGTTILLIHRARAFRLWPSAIAFLPMAAYLFWHFPVLAAYANPNIAWYARLSLFEIPLIAAYVIGLPLMTLAIWTVLAMVLQLTSGRLYGKLTSPSYQRAVLMTGLSTLGACSVVVLLGFVRPSFTARYLTPFVPGILLLASFYVWRLARYREGLMAALLVAFSISSPAVSPFVQKDGVSTFEYETASRWISETHPSQLKFMWDNPSAVAIPQSQLDAMGGVFFRRSGFPIAVEPVIPVRGADMNAAMLKSTTADTALLWVYDTLVHDTTATLGPPHLDDNVPLRECRRFGEDHFVVEACRRRAL